MYGVNESWLGTMEWVSVDLGEFQVPMGFGKSSSVKGIQLPYGIFFGECAYPDRYIM